MKITFTGTAPRSFEGFPGVRGEGGESKEDLLALDHVARHAWKYHWKDMVVALDIPKCLSCGMMAIPYVHSPGKCPGQKKKEGLAMSLEDYGVCFKEARFSCSFVCSNAL